MSVNRQLHKEYLLTPGENKMENNDDMQNKAKKTLYDKKTCVYGLMQVYDASTTRIRREWGKK